MTADSQRAYRDADLTCYGRQEHKWSPPINSPLHQAWVKICSRCDRVTGTAPPGRRPL